MSKAPWVCVCFVVYLFGALFVLYRGHPHEDAYIMFKYARNIAAGLGYVYYPGGPHAEGATDFLWLLGLTGLARLGIDVAVAAALLNAGGSALAAAVLLGALGQTSLGFRERRAFGLIACSTVFVGGAIASYGGFSAMLYSALVLYLFACVVSPAERTTRSLPLVAITVALFRPDGVLFGVGFTLIGLLHAHRQGILRPYVLRCAVAVVIGLVYLAWRIDYFGLLLPLPLYVKGHAVATGKLAAVLPDWLGGAAGLRPNLLWLFRSLSSPLPFVVLAAVFYWRGRAEARISVGDLLLALLPIALFFGALAFAHQTQNVAFRFQAPMTLPALFGMLYFGARLLDRLRGEVARGIVVASMLLALVPSLVYAGGELDHLVVDRRGYIDTFPSRIAPYLESDTVIALTEAGRMAFWHDAKTIDIVGLNNPPTALEPATVAYVAALRPDIVMYNHAHTLDPIPVIGPVREVVTPFDSSLLSEMSVPLFEDEGEPGSSEHWNPIRRSARVLSEFLERSGGYEAYAVTYQSPYAHIVAFRYGVPNREALVRALVESGEARFQHAYADLAGFPFARAVPWRGGARR